MKTCERCGERYPRHSTRGWVCRKCLSRRRVGLTSRECQIITRLCGESSRNRDVAELLDISEGTVKNHLSVIFSKLGVDSRFELLKWCLTDPRFKHLVKPDEEEVA